MMEPITKDILVVDDDPIFTGVIVELLRRMGYTVDGFGSVVEMGSFACLRFYKLVLLDYRLEHLNGLEIAEYVDLFFPTTPVLLTSAFSHVASPMERKNWPSCIQGFVNKAEGAVKIANACEALMQRQVAEASLDWEKEPHGSAPFYPNKDNGDARPPWGK